MVWVEERGKRESGRRRRKISHINSCILETERDEREQYGINTSSWGREKESKRGGEGVGDWDGTGFHRRWLEILHYSKIWIVAVESIHVHRHTFSNEPPNLVVILNTPYPRRRWQRTREKTIRGYWDHSFITRIEIWMETKYHRRKGVIMR